MATSDGELERMTIFRLMHVSGPSSDVAIPISPRREAGLTDVGLSTL